MVVPPIPTPNITPHCRPATWNIGADSTVDGAAGGPDGALRNTVGKYRMPAHITF
jgi:hypothetical protein